MTDVFSHLPGTDLSLTALVTGFEPFDGGVDNPSWEAVRTLPDTLDLGGASLVLHCAELPVTFAGATAASRRLISELSPDIVIHVGLNAKAPAVMLETTAYNEQKAPIPDNAGYKPEGEPVVDGAAPVLHSTWAAPVLAGRGRAVGLPLSVSDDAGRYVCNATLFTALSTLAPGQMRPTGFVHVPGPHVVATDVVAASLKFILRELAGTVRRHRAHAAGMSRLGVPVGERRPLRVGLTGGIGAGKSTVAALLAGYGAAVIDADALARQVVEPGQPALEAVRTAFGDAVLATDGSLDRAALARQVFGLEAEEGARERLESLTLPYIAQEAAQRMDSSGAAVSVYDVPLLTEQQMEDLFDFVVVVEADLAPRLGRLTARGLDEAEARARMAHQASDAQRRAVADIVVSNNGSEDELRDEVSQLWSRLTEVAGEH